MFNVSSSPAGRPSWTRAVVLSGAAFLAAGLLASPFRGASAAQSPSACGPSINPVVCENQNAGDPGTEWEISGAGDPTLQGFATDISVNVGETARFKVDTTASTFRIDFFRLGYYGGFGARKIASLTNIAGRKQPACLTDSTTGLVDCGNWSESASWTVPAVSGIYLAVLKRLDTGGASHIVFVVRDDARRSELLFQTSDTTWQAYNDYGGNSLYKGSPAGRAYKVSYNRPFNTRSNEYSRSFLFGAEYPMVRWLEMNGYDVSYTTGVDTERRGAELLEHKAFLSVGHDEYWSAGQRANVEAARAAGVHLAFFSGNEIFWKTRWENSIDGTGTPHRTLVSYKETHANAKIDPLPNVWTGTWRDARFSPPADGGRPENALTGTLFMVNCCEQRAIGVSGAVAPFRFWRHTAVAALNPTQTATIGNGIVGYEWDEDRENGRRPAGLIRLSSATYAVPGYLQDNGSSYTPGTATHSLTLYRHSGGALVFGAGTIRWSWALDVTHDSDGLTPNVPTTPDANIQQATVNLLADMGVQPGTLQAGLSPATPTSDTVPPATTIAFPSDGQSFPAMKSIAINGTAIDSGGGVVAAVEISFDGGVTWQYVPGRENWTFNWTPTIAGAKTIQVRSVDDSGNLEPSVRSVTVTITPDKPTLGLTTIGSVLDSGDSGYLNGSKVTTSSGGQITSMSVYVGPIDTSATNRQYQLAIYADNSGQPGALVAASGTGTLIANSWNTLAISASLQPTTNYWLLYNTNGRTPSINNMYYNAGAAGQGVYSNTAVAFGTWPATFPASTVTNAVFSLYASFASAPDTTPPTITNVAPANGATAVPTSTTVAATFSEAIDAATLTTATFVLRDAANAVVPSAVSYDSATRVATLTPAAALTGSTTYSATIVGGGTGVKDTAGNALAGNFVWSFTTAAADTAPPTVTGVAPASGATGVSTATAVTATFSEAINTATLTTTTFVLRDPANVAVSAAVSYNATTRVATLTPAAALAASTTYTATVVGGSAGVKDLAGNALASNFVWSFTTAAPSPPPTTIGLTTIGSAADSGDSGYLNGSKVTTSAAAQVTSMSVYVGAIDSSTTNRQYQLAIYTDSAGRPGALVAASPSGTLVANSWNTVAVTAALQANTSYWLMYTSNGRTASVNNMYYNAGTTGQGAFSTSGVAFGTWPSTFPASTLSNTVFSLYASFGSTTDTTPPTVTGVTPASGATGVSTATAVTATFSEAINASTLTTTTFVLRDPANALVTATVSYNATTRVATLTPSAALAASTAYTATITGGSSGVKDTSGNALASNYVWSFTTGAPAPPPTTIGLTTIGSTADSGDSGYLNGSKVTTSTAAQVTSMSVYVGAIDSLTANRQYQLAIYTDSAGRPGSLVAASGTGTLVANAWNTVAVTAALQAGASYWLMYNSNGRTAAVNNMYYNAGTTGQGAFSTAGVAFGSWPSTFPASTFSNTVFSLYATLGSATDTTPPTVAGVTPANGATGVSTAAAVTATFSEAINTATLTTTTFVLRDPVNVAVPATISYNATTRVATLTPAAALASGTTYSATVIGGSTGVKDPAGNALAGNFVWSFTTLANTQESQIGAWSPLMNWPIVAIHAILLKTGNVLLFDHESSGTTQPRLWNPLTDTLSLTPLVGAQLFCSGHVNLSSGKVLTAGGHAHDTGELGIKDTYQYDPVANVWSRTSDMAFSRWYPTLTPLSDGRVLILSGQSSSGVFVDVPEVYDPPTGSVTTIPTIVTPELHEEEYPADFHLPTGKVLAISPEWGPVQLLDPVAVSWTNVGTTPIKLGSAVQYRPGRILMSGGGTAFQAPAATVGAVLDMTANPPSWQSTSPMAFGRYHHNLVMLPTGKVLAVGGASLASQTSGSGPLPVEMWDPDTDTWTTLAAMEVARYYHSTALLLPDGRVLAAGGGHNGSLPNQFSAQVYSPPYLFKGARPVIATAPDAVAYGQVFTVDSAEASTISSVSLIDLTAVTHATSMNQLYRELTFTKSAGQLSITAPQNSNETPAGFYMLFIVDSNGVPSVAKILEVGTVAPPPPPGEATVGLTSIGTTLDSGDSNYMNGSAVTTSAGGQVTSMSVYVGAIDSSTTNQQYQLAIYSDNGGTPGALVAASATGTLTANAWNTLPINASLLPATTYWLMYNTNGRTSGVNNMYYSDAGGGAGAFGGPATFGTWPATFPAATTTTSRFSLFATFAR